MKVLFKAKQYNADKNAGKISVRGAQPVPAIDFLAVMAKLYEMPFLWFSEGLLIEVDFETRFLTLTMPGGRIRNSETVTLKVPISELVNLTETEIRTKYIYPFAADAAEANFGMKKTAKAIREMASKSKISELAYREGHPVLDDEIINLLFREEWGINNSYAR